MIKVKGKILCIESVYFKVLKYFFISFIIFVLNVNNDDVLGVIIWLV